MWRPAFLDGSDAAVGQGAAPSLQRPLAIIRPLMGLLSTGGGNFAHIRKFSSAPVFLPPMGEPLPSQESFRQRNNLPRLSPIAFNCLRLIGDAAMPAPRKEREPRHLRLRTVLLDFIKDGCKVVRHANALLPEVGRNFPLLPALRKIDAIC